MQGFLSNSKDLGSGQDATRVAKSLVLWLLFFVLVFALYWNVLGYLKEQIALQKITSEGETRQYTRASLEERSSGQDLLKINMSASLDDLNDSGRIVVVKIS